MKKIKQEIRQEMIRDLYAKDYTIKDISELFELSRQYVWQVIHRQTPVSYLTKKPRHAILPTEVNTGELEKQK